MFACNIILVEWLFILGVIVFISFLLFICNYVSFCFQVMLNKLLILSKVFYLVMFPFIDYIVVIAHMFDITTQLLSSLGLSFSSLHSPRCYHFELR